MCLKKQTCSTVVINVKHILWQKTALHSLPMVRGLNCNWISCINNTEIISQPDPHCLLLLTSSR